MTGLAEKTTATRSSRQCGGFGWLLVLTAIVIIAHGCHGDDIDHEPGIGYQNRTEEK
jgi:hypothetical protein